MHYRRFGRTNLQMSVLSCGGMRFQQSWKDLAPEDLTAQEEERLEATVRRALALGVNHIETARGYGSSERQLGRLLPKLPRENIILQTKVSPGKDGSEFRKTFETSLDRLQQSQVDLLAIHGINNREILDSCLKPDGPLAELQQIRDEGLARFIGFSTHGPTDVIVDAIETDAFDYVNLHWYYFDQINAPAIAAAHAHDMGCFIISPNDKGGRLYDPPAKLVHLCQPLSPMAFNALFCLANPHVHTLSFGAGQPSDFDVCQEYLGYIPQAAETIKPVAEALEAEARRILGDLWYDTWSQDLPPYEQVPGQMHLYHILRLYGAWKAFDMLAYGKMRYNLMGNGGHWMPGQKVCLDKINAVVSLLKDSPIADQLAAALREVHAACNDEEQKRMSETD